MGRKPKTKPDAPGAEGGAPSTGHNSSGKAALTDDEMRALFFQGRDKYKAALDIKKAADADFKNVCKVIKSDGFTVDQIKIALAVVTPEGDAKERAKIRQALQAAVWAGVPLGTQLGMFDDPDRTPAVDRAFDEGKQAGMEGRTRRPPYAPELAQAEEWMRGWYEGQKTLMKEGGGFEEGKSGAVQSH
jgi:ribosome modulation factor